MLFRSMTNKLYFIPAALAAVAVIAFGFFALPYISLAAFATASSFVWTAFVATAVFAVITILRSVKFIYGSEAKVSDYIRVTMKSQTLKMALAGFVISAAFMLLSAVSGGQAESLLKIFSYENLVLFSVAGLIAYTVNKLVRNEKIRSAVVTAVLAAPALSK